MSAIPGRAALGSAFRAARAGVRGCAIALTYHRVADLPSDPSMLAVGVERFAEQIAVLAREHETLSAGQLLELMRERRPLPRRAVVVTLDDGYADALTSAKPVLEAHGVPATVFVPGEALSGEGAYWWDELEALLLAPGELPARLEIPAGTDRVTCDLGDDRVRDDAEWALRRGWDITSPPETDRQRAFLTLLDALRPLAPPDRSAALTALREQAPSASAPRPDQRRLGADGMRELESGGLVEIGGHTMTHPFLSALPAGAQRREVAGGKAVLEEALGHPVRSFSYPYGSPGSYDAASVAAVREAGFDGAFTTAYGIVLPWMDTCTLPRCHTEDLSGEAFRRLLDGWFDAAR